MERISSPNFNTKIIPDKKYDMKLSLSKKFQWSLPPGNSTLAAEKHSGVRFFLGSLPVAKICVPVGGNGHLEWDMCVVGMTAWMEYKISY